MCFEFGSCFGNGRRQDYGGERSTPKPERRERRGDRRNGYYSGTDHKAPAPAYHQQPHTTAVDEVGHKAYHDGARKDHNAAYVQADNDTPKLPAWQNKVGNDAGNAYTYTYTYTARLHEAAADHRESAAMDYRHYPNTNANTTTLVRY